MFNPLSVPTEAEQAATQGAKSSYYGNLINAGVVSPEEVRQALRQDENSGFTDIAEDLPEDTGGGMGGGMPGNENSGQPPSGNSGGKAEGHPSGKDQQDIFYHGQFHKYAISEEELKKYNRPVPAHNGNTPEAKAQDSSDPDFKEKHPQSEKTGRFINKGTSEQKEAQAETNTEKEKQKEAEKGKKEESKTESAAEKQEQNLVSGALNPDSIRANEHAELYYEEIRHRKDDVFKIAKTTGYAAEQIKRIKNYLFVDKHQLATEFKRFDPDYAICESWRRLALGKPEPHDITMINHEIAEMELIDSGMPQDEAHKEASKKYNYKK